VQKHSGAQVQSYTKVPQRDIKFIIDLYASQKNKANIDELFPVYDLQTLFPK